jgi:non-heme chloroperoxidase
VTAFDTRIDVGNIVLSSGLRLRYLHGGAADGPVVLMLHGLSDSSYSYRRVLPLLPPHLRFIAIDQRGHGDSDRPVSGYSMDDLAADAIDVLDELGIARAVVVGHSMGSFVARKVAERDPHRVERLVLIGTALSPRNALLAELRTVLDALKDPIREPFIREFQMSCVHQPVPAEFMNAIVADSAKVPSRVWQAAIEGLWRFEARWPLSVPTAILGGENDAVFSRAEQAALFEATERSSLHLEPGIGHCLHWEAPERFIKLAFEDLAK